MKDLSNHPFSVENVAREIGCSDSDTEWERFYDEVERLLGHDLDGNDINGVGDGYSIDEACIAWQAGSSAHAFVAMVSSRDRYLAGRKAAA